MKKGFNPRNLLAIGLAIMAYSLWLMSHFNLETGFYAVSYPRLIQGIGMGLFFVPLSAATYVNIPREETGNASGVFNLLRNLGGSFGVAFSSTVLAQRAQVHQTFLAEHVTPYNPVFQMHSEKIQQWLESSYPAAANQTGVLSVVYREVLRQASMLAFNDTFWLLAIITAVLVFFTPIFKRPKRAALPMEGVH